MREIILSIHANHAEHIPAGHKTIELRKTAPKSLRQRDGEPFKVYLCVTGGVGIVGHFEVHMLIDIIPELLKQDTLLAIANHACVTYNQLRDYNPRYGWAVTRPIRYAQPLPIEHFGLKRPPQSWQYVPQRKKDTKRKDSKSQCSHEYNNKK